MIRPISISFDGMRITGTVESPDARPARYFKRSDGHWSALVLSTTKPRFYAISTEFEPGMHVSERAV